MANIQYFYRLNPILDINGVNESYSYYKTETNLSTLRSGSTYVIKNNTNKVEYIKNNSGYLLSRYYIHYSGLTLNNLQIDGYNEPELKGIRFIINNTSNNDNISKINYPFFDLTKTNWNINPNNNFSSIVLNNNITNSIINTSDTTILTNLKNIYNGEFYFGFMSNYDAIEFSNLGNTVNTFTTEPIIELLYEIDIPNEISINKGDINVYHRCVKRLN